MLLLAHSLTKTWVISMGLVSWANLKSLSGTDFLTSMIVYLVRVSMSWSSSLSHAASIIFWSSVYLGASPLAAVIYSLRFCFCDLMSFFFIIYETEALLNEFLLNSASFLWSWSILPWRSPIFASLMTASSSPALDLTRISFLALEPSMSYS